MPKKERLGDHELRPPNPFLLFSELSQVFRWLNWRLVNIAQMHEPQDSPGHVTYLCTQGHVLLPRTAGGSM